METSEIDFEQEETIISGKQPWLGAFLNFFGFPGFGYFYSQDTLKAILCLLLVTSCWILTAFLLLSNKMPLAGLLLAVLAFQTTLYLFASVDVFRTIKKRNPADYEHPRTNRTDPWMIVFWSFIWPGLGYLFLRKRTQFAFTSCFNILTLALISLIGNSAYHRLAFHIGYSILYCGLFALHGYKASSWQVECDYKIKPFLLVVGYKFLCFIFAAFIAVIFIIYIAQFYRVPAGSMLPTIQAGDCVLVNKVYYDNKKPAVGDIIAFQKKGWDFPYIKRVVAIEGQIISSNSEGQLLIDGILFSPVHLDTKAPAQLIEFQKRRKFIKNGKIEIPSGHYYVIGDNYYDSIDSRDWGPILSDDIIGKAVRIASGDSVIFK